LRQQGSKVSGVAQFIGPWRIRSEASHMGRNEFTSFHRPLGTEETVSFCFACLVHAIRQGLVGAGHEQSIVL
jgi:hypothetical protein